MTVKTVSEVTIDALGVRLAMGVSAGHWVFGNGLTAVDDEARMPRELTSPSRPYSGLPVVQQEAEHLFARVKKLLTDADSSPVCVTRLDQYYTEWQAVPPYHVARHQAFSGVQSIPTSTSILMEGFLWPGAHINMELLAVTDAVEPPLALTPDGLEVPSVMGFAPVVVANGLVFLAGQMAEADGHAGVAEAAQVPPTHYWKGHAVALETAFILREKFAVALAAGGSSKDTAVKGQAYVTDITQAPAVLRAWHAFFGDDVPALSIIPAAVPGFNCKAANIEINLVAATEAKASERHVIAGEHAPALDGVPAAVVVGDLMFCSGLVAADETGPVRGAQPDPEQPWFSRPGKVQMQHILKQVDALCAKAGTQLENATRIQLFMTDLSEFRDVCSVLQARFGDRAIPLSVIQVPGPLVVPGCSVMADLCLYTRHYMSSNRS